MGRSLTRREMGDLKIEPQAKHAQTEHAIRVPNLQVLCCHLANTNEKLDRVATAIPYFAQLLWSVLG